MSVQQHPARWSKVKEESSQSWPVPVLRDGHHFIAFLYFTKSGRPPVPPSIFPPYYQVLVDVDMVEAIEFTPLSPIDFQINISVDKSLGEHRLSSEMSMAQFKIKKSHLYLLYDQVLPLYWQKNNIVLTKEQISQICEFRMLFYQLAEKPLLPFYKALNLDFFAWIDKFEESQQ